ncbi:MAG TPA: FeoA family protein, partial [Rubrobacter sp.]|nr:FeoA family protein [Rubrobacter sp.]
ALPPADSQPLSKTEAGGCFVISRVENRDPAVLTYLRDLGLMPGRVLRVREVRALDGVVTTEDEDGVSQALGAPLARSILVRHRA